ncbi:MAG TPA: pimeloyl-CoA dehydrogenase small subunit, partial [Sulfitobacter sp.]|nr:pimeloyl-CoA dehydrogenase small subunit [Sulfitobacter sp.]
ASDVLIVSARTSGEVSDENGISLYFVEKDAAGLTIQDYALIAGGHAAEVTLDGVEGSLIGEEGKGFALLKDAYAIA